jgi:hypothetical protein
MLNNISDICYPAAVGVAAIVGAAIVTIEYDIMFEDYIVPFISDCKPEIMEWSPEEKSAYLSKIKWILPPAVLAVAALVSAVFNSLIGPTAALIPFGIILLPFAALAACQLTLLAFLTLLSRRPHLHSCGC